MMNKLEINKIYNMDCLEGMKLIDDESIDMVLTSPPYDGLRDYDGFYSFNFEEIAKEIFRILKRGSVLVWVVSDSYDKNGSESLTSFKQCIFFKEIGFNVHDTMIYYKNSYPFPPRNRYYQQFEYMFVLSKGKPRTVNLLRQKTVWKKKNNEISTYRKKNGNTSIFKYEKGKEYRILDNVWRINTGYMRSTKDKIAYKHPAIFPEELVEKHILSWSNVNDVVLDPFLGSGTTVKVAKLLNRKFIGFEINQNYFELAQKRINNGD